MARPIVWSDPAVDDLEAAVEFIAKLIIGSYRLIYLVESERVLIVAVLHGHRALRRGLKGRK